MSAVSWIEGSLWNQCRKDRGFSLRSTSFLVVVFLNLKHTSCVTDHEVLLLYMEKPKECYWFVCEKPAAEGKKTESSAKEACSVVSANRCKRLGLWLDKFSRYVETKRCDLISHTSYGHFGKIISKLESVDECYCMDDCLYGDIWTKGFCSWILFINFVNNWQENFYFIFVYISYK